MCRVQAGGCGHGREEEELVAEPAPGSTSRIHKCDGVVAIATMSMLACSPHIPNASVCY